MNTKANSKQRIVSLVPSQTELLHYLGLEEEVVGITKFCVHPDAWFRSKTRVGGTKTLHLDRIEALEPTLILGNKEENTKEQIEALAEKYRVWISDVRTLSDALDMIRTVGQLCDRQEEGLKLSDDIALLFEKELAPTPRRLKALYLIWRKPYMGVGADTFIHDMLLQSGFDNVLSDRVRYPELDASEIQALNPEVIMLSSEPYPFKEAHVQEFSRLCPAAVITKVDGELFSWYGSRLLQSPAYIRTLRDQLFEKIG